jgi:hypothetical protein
MITRNLRRSTVKTEKICLFGNSYIFFNTSKETNITKLDKVVN